MHRNKILTIDDLIKFCEENNFSQYNSKETGYSLHVQVPCEKFELEDTDDPYTLFANVRLMHTGRNRNKSTLTEKGAKSCLSKIAYKPVLADFTDVNGERDFTYHAMEFNDDGTRTYIEKQVGCFTSDKPYMKQDPDHEDRQYIYARVAIPREYTDAAEIIEKKGGTKVSAELSVNDMSYSVDDGLLLNDVEVMGCTLLGTDPETGNQVQEGMEGAFLQIEDFSATNNTVIDKQNLIEEITNAVYQRLNDKKAFAETTTGKEEEKPMDFEENINEVTEETNDVEVTEVMAETTDEDTVIKTEATEEEAKKSEETAEETPDEVVEDEEATEEITEEFDGDNTDAGNVSGDESGDESSDGSGEDSGEDTQDEHQSVSAIEDEDSTEGTPRVENSLSYSITTNGITKEFRAISLGEKINALTTLVNDTYSEADNTYYCVDVYEEDRYVIMHDFWGDKHYKQEFQVKKDVYSLKSDRIPVFAQYLTQDQINQLDKMKSDFASIEEQLNTYKAAELHAKREEILAAEDYSVMADFAEFTELKNNMDNYSIEDLSKEADLVYAKFMKSNYSFAGSKEAKKRSMVFMNTGIQSEEERLPYGGLFKNFKNKNK